MNQQPNPALPPEKKGMSKGCLVGLIVGIVLVVIVAALVGIWIYMGDDLMKTGAVTYVNAITTELANNPVDGVDTVAVNVVSQAFLHKLDTSDVELQRFGALMQGLGGILADKQVDADEADRFIDMMVNYYPELGDLLPPEDEPVEDTTVVIDSLEQVE